MRPRAINADGTPKSADDWVVSETLVKYGAAIGANSTIRCGITLGDWCMIGSGSVVTHDVPMYGLVFGNPAALHGFVCPCGEKLEKVEEKADVVVAQCPKCARKIEIDKKYGWKQNDIDSETCNWDEEKKAVLEVLDSGILAQGRVWRPLKKPLRRLLV
jgi:hypothetical protein